MALAAVLVLAGCGTSPVTRDEAEYPEALRIPPDLVGERQAEAERRRERARADRDEDAGEADEPLPEDPVRTVPTRLGEADGQPVLDVSMSADRGWTELGRALDRMDFTVLDRFRDDGEYRIRYAPFPDREPRQPGFFARVFTGAERIDTDPRPFRLRVAETPQGARLTVHEDDGEPAPAVIAERLLTLFDRQLRE